MKEYQQLIDMYSLKGYDMYSKSISRSEWGDLQKGEEYLGKYWLTSEEYESKWEIVLKSIFINRNTALPNLVFSKNFDLLVLEGGCLFVEEDFKKLQECILNVGDEFLFIIENDFGGRLKEPTFRMRFPSDINWQELNSGNFVSSTLLESIHKEFFVFGESGVWGKYSANDYDFPLDIVGFKESYKELFTKVFEQSEHELNNVKKHLPQEYICHLKSL
ncbi:hypothetical protein DBR40_05505 [Pedobacter sp. KBW01]|uniref:hypothetical protein n=1 Tax=Pedobacter sp. KBW01 TaxID=2153364 RepID=UPI000F5AA823|nr:hypothetical protein [Pedobacter sp. KBW01]RQO78716.1 hypothetical protein DBR40_05505 [Pedobacter sp. KBW01]